MAHSYRILHHWNQWLSQQFLGKQLLEAEEQHFARLLERHFGKHGVLIGVPHQYNLLNSTKISCLSILTPLANHNKKTGYIEGDFHELPLLTGSIDLVILPHTLEFIDNPRQLLSEACRIIKPEGLMIISGFNPYSLWGLKKLLSKHKKSMPWNVNLIHPQKIKNWLQLADFVLEKQESALLTLPFNRSKWYKKLQFLEKIGGKLFPMFGSIYVIIARAKVVPLTPIRLKWKQQLSGIRISTTISGNIARQLK
ncbi:MAG: methyltransferase domain-containing protein [Gammaproteobacteria bacterium]|nr:methyltransferase domain-containing protein [Gammaproteobacteria bacterium]MCW5584218.1 methyltransferase domain-containing protein [Gammaproteobacteria bacterium]